MLPFCLFGRTISIRKQEKQHRNNGKLSEIIFSSGGIRFGCRCCKNIKVGIIILGVITFIGFADFLIPDCQDILYPPEYIRDYPGPVPKCECGGRIKPDVVLYEEGLDNDVVMGAVQVISKADLMIVAGTSLTVYPAAGLVRYFRGKHLVLINRDATPMDSECDLVIHDKVGVVLSSLG